MVKPLESSHIAKIVRDICEYLEVSDSPEAKHMAAFGLKMLEDDAKRALGKALSISDELLKFIDSPSDVVYDSHLGIDETDDNYILTRAIADALHIILTITCYHYIDNIKTNQDKSCLIEQIQELYHKTLAYRFIEIEQEVAELKLKQTDAGKTNKAPKGLCALIGEIVENDIGISAVKVWNKIKSEITSKPDKKLVIELQVSKAIHHLSYDHNTSSIIDYDDETGNKQSSKYTGGFKDHVTAAKKHYKNKKPRSK